MIGTAGLELAGLAKRFGARVAVEGLSFCVQPGEIFGLLGPNGAGKTTTVRMLAGLLVPSQGEALVCGRSVRTQAAELRKVIGLLTEQPGLYDRLTGRENLRFFMKLHELDEARAWERARVYLARFGLSGREDEPCGTYSKGMRQKLAIIRALLHEPQVLFLDEPTSGLDPESARTVRDAVAELAGEGRTVVLCSHNLAEVERLCARIAIVKNRLLAVESISELRRKAFVLELRLEGEAARFANVLESLPLSAPATFDGALARVSLSSEEHAPEVVAALVRAGGRIFGVRPAERPLEESYLELVGQESDA